jgi:hypothetical protein
MVKFLYNFIKLITFYILKSLNFFLFFFYSSSPWSSSDIKFTVGTFILFRSGTLKEHIVTIMRNFH